MVLSKYINKASWKKRLQWVPASYKAAHLGEGRRAGVGLLLGKGNYGGAGMGRPWWEREISGLRLSPLGPPELCVGLRSTSDLPAIAF